MEGKNWVERAAVLLSVVLGAGLALLSVRWLLPVLLPFAIGAILALFARKLALRASKKLPTGALAAGILTVLLLFLGLLLFTLARRLLEEGRALLLRLPALQSEGEGVRERLFDFLEKLFGDKAEDLLPNDWFGGLLERIFTGLTDFLGGLLSGAPDLFFSLVVTVIAAYAFSIEGFSSLSRIVNLFPKSIQSRVPLWKLRLRGLSFCYLRAYALLFLITFFELFVGFLILKIDYPFLLSFLIAFVDLLPVLGTGTVLLPWAIFLFAAGKVGQGSGLVVLYLVITLVRQFVEPHILGKSLGLHPLLTLFAGYAGWRFFGASGLIFAPLLLLLLRGIFSQQNKTPHAP